MRNVIAKVHGGLAWIIVAAVVAQFFFAGLGLFGATDLRAHRLTGSLIVPASLILLILALAGRLGMRQIGLSALLLVLTIVQNLLVRGPSLIAALHPVNALLVLGAAVTLARSGAVVGTPRRSANPVRGGVR